MIDIKFIRENPDVVRASQKGRGEDTSIVDQLLALDETRRTAITEFETRHKFHVIHPVPAQLMDL